MIDDEIIASLKKRYSEVHPLLFQRSIEHASSAGNLFDILDTMPKYYPIYWNEKSKCWMHTDDFTFQKEFFEGIK